VKLRSVQVLRGIAACAVVVLHASNYKYVQSPARVGAAGVDLFFVISCFIMATVASDKTPGRFLADRAWRILPLWFIAVMPWLLAPTDPDTIASSLTLWPIHHHRFVTPVLTVGWTLSYEFLFYFAFALALASRALIPLAAYGVFFLLAFLTNDALLCFLGSPLVLEFLAGVLIARLRRASFGGAAIMLCGFAWIALTQADVRGGAPSVVALWRALDWGFGAALIVYGAISCERLFGRRAWDVPVFLGDASYSIYLFHLLIVPRLAWPFSIAGGIGLGIAAHLLIERRMLGLRAKLPRLDLIRAHARNRMSGRAARDCDRSPVPGPAVRSPSLRSEHHARLSPGQAARSPSLRSEHHARLSPGQAARGAGADGGI
jgi:exopolysaccharide production protein ExoZ